MYIEPNSEVRLLSGVPLNTTQENTLWFKDLASQTEYFMSKTRQSFDRVSYQRVNRGFFRCEASIVGIYDVNYMMFKNSGYENKWFYAFVTSVEWLNNSTAQINFEIDPLQTYFFDITIKQCFVEREHHATDIKSDWLVSENLPTGYMEYDQPKKSNVFDDWSIMVLTPYDSTGARPEVTYNYGGVECSCFMYVFDTPNEFTTFINGISTAGYGDQILSCQMIPSEILAGCTPTIVADTGQITEIPKNKSGAFSIEKPQGTIGKYTPKNKKLLSYPYSYLNLSNGSGKNIELRWEYFQNNTCVFQVLADFISNIYTAIPVNYDGTAPEQTTDTGNTNANINYGLSMGGAPQIPWLSDTYKIYLAQNKVALLDNFAMSAVEIASGMSTGKFTSELNGVNAIKNNLVNLEQMKKAPVGYHGGGGDNSLFSMDYFDFFMTHVHVSEEIAKVIDEYFTMFGYATNRVKKPNIHVRKNFTYTKTVDCCVTGHAPNDDIVQIQNIFNNGIRFWVNADNVGDYTVDNSVL